MPLFVQGRRRGRTRAKDNAVFSRPAEAAESAVRRDRAEDRARDMAGCQNQHMYSRNGPGRTGTIKNLSAGIQACRSPKKKRFNLPSVITWSGLIWFGEAPPITFRSLYRA